MAETAGLRKLHFVRQWCGLLRLTVLNGTTSSGAPRKVIIYCRDDLYLITRAWEWYWLYLFSTIHPIHHGLIGIRETQG